MDYTHAMNFRAILLASCAAAALLPAVQADAGDRGRHRDDQPAQPRYDQRYEERHDQRAGQRGGISLDQAVSMAERRYGARAVRAERAGDNYRIRLLSPDGRVFNVTVDAATGEIR